MEEGVLSGRERSRPESPEVPTPPIDVGGSVDVGVGFPKSG